MCTQKTFPANHELIVHIISALYLCMSAEFDRLPLGNLSTPILSHELRLNLRLKQIKVKLDLPKSDLDLAELAEDRKAIQGNKC